jgi:hypothetical protein
MSQPVQEGLLTADDARKRLGVSIDGLIDLYNDRRLAGVRVTVEGQQYLYFTPGEIGALAERPTQLPLLSRPADVRQAMSNILNGTVAPASAFAPLPARKPRSIEWRVLNRTGWTYLLRGDDGPVKIGKADHLPRRLREIQAMNPAPLTILGILPLLDGGQDTERALHRRFAAARCHGEWFALPDEQIAMLLGVATTIRRTIPDFLEGLERFRDECEQRKITRRMRRDRPLP